MEPGRRRQVTVPETQEKTPSGVIRVRCCRVRRGAPDVMQEGPFGPLPAWYPVCMMEPMATPDAKVRTPHGETAPYRPLTQRVLDRLPGWRWPWIVAWSLLAGGPYYVTQLITPSAPYPGDAFVVTATSGTILSMWGAGVVSRRLDALQSTLAELLPDEPDPPAIYRSLGSLRWPVILTLLSTVAFEGVDFVLSPSLATALRVPLTFVGTLAGITFMWVVGALLVTTYRVGTRRLALRPFHVDPGLGLMPLGRLAFTGFIILIAMLGPVVFASAGDVRADIFLLLVMFGGVSLFFVSLSTLHQQATAAKAERLAWARRLYGEAVTPLEAGAEAGAAAAQSSSLLAAAEIERKVLAIPEWPIDDWIWRAILAVLIGATAGVVARAIGSGLAL